MLQKPVGYTIVCTLMLAITMPACRKKSWDEYYGRPDSLEPPIYQTLEAKGNFKTFLAVIDKSGYKTTLSTAGYWTLFAPHDSAYAVYFRENGISGVEQLDSAACRQLVTYTLAFNGFKKDRIDDYQSNAGWVPNQSFKRRTANYTWVYDGVNTNNQPIKIINSNRNNNGTQFFVDADNNNKYIPIFTDTFFAARALTPGDYTYFYPGRSFSGFHIADATVIEKDIVAENGVVHVINKVITPLPSIDEYLATKPEYSEFKKLLDRFLVEYVPNPTITDRYRVLTGKPDQVFTKVYNAVLAFSPNNENFLKQQDNDGQQNGYTVFIPNNTVLLQYINNVLLEHYPSVEALPRQVLIDFVNAHFWQTTVWPSKFNNTFSFLGEPAKFNPSADVQDKRVLSNGMFYGTSKVQEANVFSSVFGKVYLDPNYSYMLRLMEQELKFVVSNPSQRFTIFMVSNQAWNQAGYFADATVDNNPNFHWRYIPPGGGANVVGSSALVRMIRLINQHVVPNTGADVESLAGQGVFKNYAGEFVRYDNNQVFASGNLDSNYFANVSSFKRSANGTVFYIDKLLTYTELQIGRHIEKLGTPATSPFNYFWQYLRNSAEYNAATGEIAGVAAGVFYTILIPTNAAIQQAVNDGLLPGTGTAPNKTPLFNPTTPLDRELVSRFIKYHILNKVAIGTNGQESGAYETMQRKNNGDATTIFVNNTTVNAMRVTDMEGRNANIIFANSNYLSNRCIIHLTDNYLRYML